MSDTDIILLILFLALKPVLSPEAFVAGYVNTGSDVMTISLVAGRTVGGCGKSASRPHKALFSQYFKRMNLRLCDSSFYPVFLCSN
jgi:hypothetical protein